METILIAVRDNAVEAYQQPLTVRARGEAIRWFIDLVNNPENRNIHNNPGDFDLYAIGRFDDQTARLTTFDQPERLIRGIDAKRSA